MIAWLKAKWAWLVLAIGSALGGLALLFRSQRNTARKEAADAKREAADANTRAEINAEAAARARAEAEAAAKAQAEHDARRDKIKADLDAKRAAHEAERDAIVTDSLKHTGSVAKEAIRRREARKRGEQ